MSFDGDRGNLGRTENRVQFHVVIEARDADLRTVLTSVEVFNNADGKTMVFIGNPKERPQR